MQQINIDELKTIQLSILDYIHTFCMKNNIRYSLCGGTLIGAVRHKGYIPWDDDIDIIMPRADYEKFCSSFNCNTNYSKFKVLTCFNDRQYFQPFAKVVDTQTKLVESYDRPIDNLGVYVDVFPVDFLPNSFIERKKYWKKIFKKRNFATVIYQKRNKNEGFVKRIFRIVLFYLFRFLPANIFAKKINKFATKKYFSSDYVACSVFGYGKKEEMPKSVFNSCFELEFEGKKYNVMCGYKTYLKNIYGDYMKLPPKENQVPKHDFRAYWR
ncbi:LicD family protein [uncultured Treponema sp.]|uniref:LicD family protein n=2 Tax=uncultured Treponema sp. TaxID=162155 RepID=UPI0026105240|nr:LicD family protein [uncultured Treponema sp.]